MVGRVHREGALDADAEADLADGEGLAEAGALAADDRALEDLDPLLGALDHPHVHLERVARSEVGDVVPQAPCVDEIGGVHGTCSGQVLARSGRQADVPAVRGPANRSSGDTAG